MNFEVLNQIIEKASQRSLELVSAEITKSNDAAMAIIMLMMGLMVTVVLSQIK